MLRKHMKNILITGASSGLGAEFARQYASTLTRLFLIGRDESRLNQIAEECRANGADVHAQKIDVCDRTKMAEWIGEISNTHGIDIVIANAGISGGFNGQAIENITDDYTVFDVNLTGVLNTIYPALPAMVKHRAGQVVMISSIAGFVPLPSAPAYSASKAAVRYYGEALMTKLKPFHVDVTVICPGFIVSRMTDVNNFPMPFIMPTDKAVSHMIKGISARKKRIDFPWMMAASLKILGIMPVYFQRVLFSKLPDKS